MCGYLKCSLNEKLQTYSEVRQCTSSTSPSKECIQVVRR